MRTRIALAGFVLATLAGCGESSDVASSPDSTPTASPSLRADAVLNCGRHEIPLDRLTNPQPATGVQSAPKRVLFKFKPGDIGDLSTWSIVDDEPERVSLIRAKPGNDDKTGLALAYQFGTWQYVADAPNATTDWMYFGGADGCPLKRSFDGLNEATTTIDPAALPQPSDRSIQLLVLENSCAGGKQAIGRIRVPVLEVTPDEVRVAIGVATQEGAHTCPGHPPTPYTLELPEPLGDRPLMDATVYPEREIKPGKNTIGRAQ